MKHNIDGKNAELAVIDYLKKNKFKILDHNWKTEKCEIDIVAKKNGCIYFVEVKFRGSAQQGTGFEYITASKLRQMEYAAGVWAAVNRWDGEVVLSGAAVDGPEYSIDFIEQL